MIWNLSLSPHENSICFGEKNRTMRKVVFFKEMRNKSLPELIQEKAEKSSVSKRSSVIL